MLFPLSLYNCYTEKCTVLGGFETYISPQEMELVCSFFVESYYLVKGDSNSLRLNCLLTLNICEYRHKMLE